MQFITQGGQLLTNNLNVARGRMFLMTADVPKPDAATSLSDLMAKIDKARSFSHQRLDDGTLNCTRAAGWLSNQYYHTLVGPMRYDWSDESSGSAVNYLNSGSYDHSVATAFARIYSIGSVPQPSSSYKDDTGTLHDTVSARYEVPGVSFVGTPVMILPPFAGQTTDGTLYTVVDTASTNNTSSSGSIGTIGQYENRDARYVQTFYIYKDSSAVNLRSFSSSLAGLSNYTAGTETSVGAAATGTIPGPRLMYCSAWASRGNRYFSGGGWAYGYTRSRINGNLIASADLRKLYGKGTNQADTAAYVFDWALMPVLLPDNRVLLQVMDFVQDLTQTGQATTGTLPQIKSNVNLLSAPATVFSV